EALLAESEGHLRVRHGEVFSEAGLSNVCDSRRVAGFAGEPRKRATADRGAAARDCERHAALRGGGGDGLAERICIRQRSRAAETFPDDKGRIRKGVGFRGELDPPARPALT